MNKFLTIVTVTLFVSCNNQEKKAVVDPDQTVIDTKGILMNADTLKHAPTASAGAPKAIKALAPTVIPIHPNQGDAGGISMMQKYTTDHGLALDAIAFGNKSALCDKWGNLWFGTLGGGVSRYDGKSFTNFTTAQGLVNSAVLSILQDNSGHIWFGTSDGVSCYDGKSFTNFTTAQGLANNHVFSICQDKAGNLWFGTNGGGVSRYDGKTFTNFTTAEGLAHDIVYGIIEDKTGHMWFATKGGGVSRFDGKSFTNFTTAQGLANNLVQSIALDHDGNIWFGTNSSGLSRYDGKSFTNFSTAKWLANDEIYCITVDKQGSLWLGTSGGGVIRYDGKSFTNFTTAQGLANDIVYSITEDKTGCLWFGTDGGGLCRYDGKSFTNFTDAQGLANKIVFSIGEDRAENLWFGTFGNGVSRYDGKSFTNFTTAQGLASDVVYCILEDKAGNLWFGTDGGGVSRYDGKTFANFTTAQGLLRNRVYCMAEDKSGNIWFGTQSGVSRYDGTSFTHFTTAQGLSNNIVYCITEDKDGYLWFGTFGGGVSRYDGKYFTNFTTEQGLANDVVFSIAQDKAGNLWFGTLGGGLSRYDGRSFLNFTTAQGLPDNTITQVLITKEENLAIGTNIGVAVVTSFYPKSGAFDSKSHVPAVNNLSNHELKNYEPAVEIYNSATGYPVKDVNSGGHCLFLDSKGIIWIGTGADKTALVRFDYKALHKNPDPPLVIIQNIRVNEEPVCWYDLAEEKSDLNGDVKKDSTNTPANVTEEVTRLGKTLSEAERLGMRDKFADVEFDSITKFYPLPQNLVLPYNRNQIGFEFAAIEPARPYLVKYQYMLEGYNDDWSPLTDKTDVSFGNIREGTYTFKLKARSPFGIWSEPVAYTFRVLPPWWRTWWMYAVYACITIGLIALIVWYNGKKLRARAKELKAKVEEATITIIQQKEIVEKQKEIVEEKHKEITDSINYAERIQRSLLASQELLDENLKEYFVFFQPKDVVSGDFYWAKKLHNDNFVLVTGDSTGHGVPGAIMSILNISCIEKAIEVEKLVLPNEIFNHARSKIIETLKKDGSVEGGMDGMDGSLVCFDFKNKVIQCACANSTVWIVRGNELIDVEGDRFPIGRHKRDQEPFTLHTLNLQKGDVVYALTDGFPDQFGGPMGKKFRYKPLQQLLLSMAHESMPTQKQKLIDVFDGWKRNLAQVDDVTIVGIRV